MSEPFARAAKAEMAQSEFHSRGEEKAFVSGLLHTAGSITLSRGKIELSLPTDNETLFDRVCSLLEKIYKDLSGLCSEDKKILLNGDQAERVLEDCGIFTVDDAGERHINYGIERSLVEKDRYAAAYLKGAFLGCGSVSVVKGYHLEYALSNAKLAGDIAELFREKDINVNVTERKDKYVSYVKGADGVSDALALLGAPKAVVELNSRFADRELQRRVNRLKNCDLANIDKSISASARHSDAIKTLKESGRYETLDGKLKETAILREENPEMTLSELAAAAGITKSGMRHRLDKLVELAERC